MNQQFRVSTKRRLSGQPGSCQLSWKSLYALLCPAVVLILFYECRHVLFPPLGRIADHDHLNVATV